MTYVMKQILIILTQNHACIPKAGEIKQSVTIGLINKLESQERCRKSIKSFRICQAPLYPCSSKKKFKHSICNNEIFSILFCFLIFSFQLSDTFYFFYLLHVNKIKTAALYLFLLISFRLNVILNDERTRKIIFFITINFFENVAHLGYI